MAKGILLRKPDKPSYLVPKAYRVISLLECLGKVVEKVVAGKISRFCEERAVLHEGQFGSRRNRGTQDAILQLITFVERAWHDKQLAGAIFMAAKGAFDRVNQKRLTQVLINVGLSQNLVKWVESFLQERKVQLVIDGHECPIRDVSAGLPQGSPVSPILFIVYLHGLLKRVEEGISQGLCISFADDIGILVRGASVDEVAKRLEQAGLSLIQKGEEHKICFEEKKTEAVLFTRRRRLNRSIRQTQIQLPNFACHFNEEATRWLGYWLDSKLSFQEHAKIRYQKAEKVLHALAGLSKKNGLPMSLLHKIQVAAVHSVALFGSEIWWNGQKNWQDKIQKLLNKQARAITGLFKTTPVPFLLEEANLPDAAGLLNARHLGLVLRCLKMAEGHPSRTILPPSFRFGEIGELGEFFSEMNLEWTEPKGGDIGKRLARDLNKAIPITLESGIDYYHDFYHSKRQGPSEFPSTIRVLERKQAIGAAQANRDTAIFTDGSRMGQKDREKAGASIAQVREGKWWTRGWHLGYGKTALDAELFALSQALKEALKRPDSTKVFTDSQGALNYIKRGQPLPSTIGKIWESAEELSKRGTPVTLLWAPGHKAVEGNEKADQAAKKAAKGGKNEDPTTSVLYLKEQVIKEKAQHRHQFLPALQKGRKALTARFLQLKCGHAAIGSYRKRFRGESARCRWCGNSNEDPTHALLRCKEWKKQRKQLVADLAKKGIFLSHQLTRKDTQKLFQKEAAEATLGFLAETQIGVFKKEDSEEWLDTWDLQLLDPGGREGGEGSQSPSTPYVST